MILTSFNCSEKEIICQLVLADEKLHGARKNDIGNSYMKNYFALSTKDQPNAQYLPRASSYNPHGSNLCAADLPGFLADIAKWMYKWVSMIKPREDNKSYGHKLLTKESYESKRSDMEKVIDTLLYNEKSHSGLAYVVKHGDRISNNDLAGNVTTTKFDLLKIKDLLQVLKQDIKSQIETMPLSLSTSDLKTLNYNLNAFFDLILNVRYGKGYLEYVEMGEKINDKKIINIPLEFIDSFKRESEICFNELGLDGIFYNDTKIKKVIDMLYNSNRNTKNHLDFTDKNILCKTPIISDFQRNKMDMDTIDLVKIKDDERRAKFKKTIDNILKLNTTKDPVSAEESYPSLSDLETSYLINIEEAYNSFLTLDNKNDLDGDEKIEKEILSSLYTPERILSSLFKVGFKTKIEYIEKTSPAKPADIISSDNKSIPNVAKANSISNSNNKDSSRFGVKDGIVVSTAVLGSTLAAGVIKGSKSNSDGEQDYLKKKADKKIETIGEPSSGENKPSSLESETVVAV